MGSYSPVTYVPATTGTNECASGDISAFVTACVTGSNTQTTCPAWFAANVAGGEADGGGAGNACGNCIAAPNNNGGIWSDPNGYFAPNYAGCIQLTDSTNGSTCAAAFNQANGCDGFYCDQCTDQNDYNACSAAATQCTSYNTASNTDCAADLSADAGTAVCFPSEASGASDQSADFTYIINLICGTGQ